MMLQLIVRRWIGNVGGNYNSLSIVSKG